jgi:hypothetical protein
LEAKYEVRFCKQWLMEAKWGNVLQAVVTGGKMRQSSADSGYWRQIWGKVLQTVVIGGSIWCKVLQTTVTEGWRLAPRNVDIAQPTKLRHITTL